MKCGQEAEEQRKAEEKRRAEAEEKRKAEEKRRAEAEEKRKKHEAVEEKNRKAVEEEQNKKTAKEERNRQAAGDASDVDGAYEMSEQEAQKLMEAALLQGAVDLNTSRLNIVGQGRAGKTALANALAGRHFVETASTMGVEQNLLEVNKVSVEAVGSVDGDVWNQVEDVRAGITLQEAQARCAAQIFEQRAQPSASVKAQPSMVEVLQHKMPQPMAQPAGATAEAVAATTASAATAPAGKPRGEAAPPSMDAADKPALPVVTGQSGDSGAEASLAQPGEPTTARSKLGGISKMDIEMVLGKVKQKDPLRLSLWDYGGQEKFYALHHLYIRRFGVYLLVFNMECLQPGAPELEESLRFLDFWLRAIEMHAVDDVDGSLPRILIVGTHKDKVPSPEVHAAISRLLDDRFRFLRAWSSSVVRFESASVKEGLGTLFFHPVDNTMGTEDPVIGKLRQSTMQVVSAEKYVTCKVPFVWCECFNELQKETSSCVPLGQVVDIFKKVSEAIGAPGDSAGLGPEQMVHLMLKYYSEMGMLMHHPDSALQHLVVLDPCKFFVMRAARVVCEHSMHSDEYMESARRERPRDYALMRHGRLNRDFLPRVWQDCEEHVADLELLMTKYGLIVPIVDADEDSDAQHYLVPALLDNQHTPSDSIFEADPAQYVFYVLFAHADVMENIRKRSRGYMVVDDAKVDAFLPSGLFASLLGKLVGECQRVHGISIDDMDLHGDRISAAFGRHRFTLQVVRNPDAIEVLVRVGTPLLIVSRILELTAMAVAEIMPSLQFGILVHQSGGMCIDGHAPQLTGSLVLLSGKGGLQERVDAEGGQDIGIGKNQRLSVLQALKIFAAFLTPKGLLRRYHIFISYRWSPFDTELAIALFNSLSVSVLPDGTPLDVFLDRQRLEDGRMFATDFATALINSTVVVPIVSFKALERMLTLAHDSEIDNVLLEWSLIVELVEAGDLSFCLPVMLGEVNMDADDPKKFVANLFVSGRIDKLPDVTCAAVTARVRELLVANGKTPTRELDTRTVKGTVKKLIGLLGVPAWDVNTSHGGAATAKMHAQSRWKQVLFTHIAGKTMECIEKAESEKVGLADSQQTEVCDAEVEQIRDEASTAKVEAMRAQMEAREKALQAQTTAQAADFEIERLRTQAEAEKMAQAKASAEAETERLRMQAEMAKAAAEAEIERLRMQAEAEKMAQAKAAAEAETERLRMQAEAEKMAQPGPQTTQGGSACCLIA